MMAARARPATRRMLHHGTRPLTRELHDRSDIQHSNVYSAIPELEHSLQLSSNLVGAQHTLGPASSTLDFSRTGWQYNSKCYDSQDRRIGCVVCHDPHKDVVTEPKAYDAKCLACHSGPGQVANIERCPVAAADWAACQLPKIELPDSHRRFSDHQLRIVRPGNPFPN